MGHSTEICYTQADWKHPCTDICYNKEKHNFNPAGGGGVHVFTGRGSGSQEVQEPYLCAESILRVSSLKCEQLFPDHRISTPS
jgi:hypothetical protein